MYTRRRERVREHTLNTHACRRCGKSKGIDRSTQQSESLTRRFSRRSPRDAWLVPWLVAVLWLSKDEGIESDELWRCVGSALTLLR